MGPQLFRRLRLGQTRADERGGLRADELTKAEIAGVPYDWDALNVHCTHEERAP